MDVLNIFYKLISLDNNKNNKIFNIYCEHMLFGQIKSKF